MPPIVVERRVPRPLPAVWAVVADVASHRLPLTRVETDPGQPRVGWGFRGISGLGPLRLVDAMVLTRWSPPRPGADAAEYAVAKVGRLLAGWADVRLEADGPAATSLRWREEILLRPVVLGRLLRPLTEVAVAWMFEREVDRLAARA